MIEKMNDKAEYIDELCINTLRMLAVDAVEKAESGHPGMPLGAAPMAYVLWTRFLKHNPKNPNWPNRDRFILSAGHGSALLYALLHLAGYDVSLKELKNFRQYGSLTPGHPEYETPGVEVTTGPLGQGFGMGVGMAIAERFMSARYNKHDTGIINHHTYAIVSDGDLMEGVASEAASIAGYQKLGKLIYLYDDNHVSIEGSTDITFTENVCERFRAYEWHVQRVEDGNDLDAIDHAIKAAQEHAHQPSLIAVRTHIGFGSPKQDSASAHGEPLGADAYKATKEFYGWPSDTPFYIPQEVKEHFNKIASRGCELEAQWLNHMECYRCNYPEEAEQLMCELNGELPKGWEKCLPEFRAGGHMATRSASGKVMNELAKELPNMIGGSADLAPSNKTLLLGCGDADADDPLGRNVHFGVREHGMGAIVNGMALHGGVIPFGATFLVFSDYMRPSIRIAALMKSKSIFVFTHDSVALGEDGPTHQPIEHLASLRAMPNLVVIRPADANETAQAWKFAVANHGPVALMLSRQNLPTIDRSKFASASNLKKGAYVLSDSDRAQIILIATGSEVHLALEAKEVLEGKGIKTRVVSMPSWELFEEQGQSYRDSVLPADITARVAVEAGSTFGWKRWVGDKGRIIGIDRFGASAPGEVAMQKLGITVENIVKQSLEILTGMSIFSA